MFNVVLVEPEIPANTGNIGRTCVLTGSRLHLVGPLGFSLDDAALKRAGLAYWQSLDVRTYSDWDEFVTACQLNTAAVDSHLHLLTKVGPRVYTESRYSEGDWLIFGKESSGLPSALLQAHPGSCERIPMLGDDTLANADCWHESFNCLHPELERDIAGNYIDPRTAQVTSLNLSNAVAIVLYEALRQTGYGAM